MDYSTEAGATELAQRLNEYWHSRGYTTVHHWIEKTATNTNRRHARHPERTDHSTHYVVCSNLINGLPPPAT